MVQSLADILFDALRAIQATRYSELGSSAIIIYDHLLTFGDEVDLIWNRPWSMGKMMFVMNRYYFLFSVIINNYGLFSPNLSGNFCLRFIQWQGWTGLIACMLTEVILQMRLYALYFLNKKVLAFMITCFIITSASAATVMGMVLSEITVTSQPFDFCIPSNVPTYFFAFWIPVLAFETLLCLLALYRGFETFRSHGGLFQSGRRLVSILIRDSVMYYLVIFLTYFTNLLVFLLAPVDKLEIPIGFAVALSCVMGNRVVLNIRRASLESEDVGKPDDWTEHRFPPIIMTPNTPLTDIEMSQLRSLRTDRSPKSHHGHIL